MPNYILLKTQDASPIERAFTAQFGEWKPVVSIPSSLRITLDGNLDTSYASFEIYAFTGTIIAPVSPSTYYGSSTIDGKTWGTNTDLMTILKKKHLLKFQDYDGTKYLVFSNAFDYIVNIPSYTSNQSVFKYNVNFTGKIYQGTW